MKFKSLKIVCFIAFQMFFLILLLVASINMIYYQTHDEFLPLASIEYFFRNTVPLIDNKIDHIFLQKDKNTCGSAALGFLLRQYGMKINEERISKLAETKDKGTSMLGLCHAAEELGFHAWGEKQNYAALKKEKFPALTLIENQHYITIVEIDDSNIYAFDPFRGMLIIPENAFLRIWNGYVLKVRPKPIVLE
jgi:hypothetical protein